MNGVADAREINADGLLAFVRHPGTATESRFLPQLQEADWIEIVEGASTTGSEPTPALDRP